MPHQLSKYPVHLGLGATAVAEPEFTGEMEWYGGYGARHARDGAEGRLVSQHDFTDSWDVWEMHPKGAEVVLCLSGEMTIIQEMPDKTEARTVLRAGEYVINARGVWHTADLDAPASALFITAGEGTEHRAR